MGDPLDAPAHELAARIGAGELRAVDVVGGHLERLADVRDRLGGVAVPAPDALDRAAAIDRRVAAGEAVGPLAGVPITVKDWIEVAGLPCCAGSRHLIDHVPATDAAAVARLRAAGAVVVAKTRVHRVDEVYGPSANPWDPRRSPGYSSAGEGVVVGAGASPLGLGSDSGGSIRLPAAWCGVAGLKPTTGRVPATGHLPRIGERHDGRTTMGPLARSVADLRLALEVIAGPDGVDPAVPPVPLDVHGRAGGTPPRFAVVEAVAPLAAADVDPAQRAALAVAVAALEAVGAEQEAVRFRRLDEAWSITERYWRRTGRTGAEVDADLADWDRFRRATLVDLGDVDLVLTPAAARLAPACDEAEVDGVGPLDVGLTAPFSLTGWPAVVVPGPPSPGGLPTSVQVAAGPWRDLVALAAAEVVERAVGGWRPPPSAP